MKYILIILLVLCSCMKNELYSYTNIESQKNIVNFKTIPIYVDESFSENQKKDIAKVLTDYNYMFNHYVELKVISWNINDKNEKEIKDKIAKTCEGILISNLESGNAFVEEKYKVGLPRNTIAFAERDDGFAHYIVVIKDVIGYRSLYGVFLHEMGHALGGMHIKTESVMYPYVGIGPQIECIDKITAAQIAETYRIDVRHMNYCRTPGFE